MKKFQDYMLIACGILAFIAFAIWIIKMPTKYPIAGTIDDAIDRMEVEFNKHEMYLDIYLNRPLTCEKVIKSLGIQSFTVKNDSYTPACSYIKESVMRITYTQDINT